ncbi:MAG TPA: flippase, partial [Patescibacteria group bacterium]|nr:flippase [Patescibacteria group bacterium]
MTSPLILASKIAKNTIYQVMGKALGTIIGLMAIGMMTRYLGQAGFGYYTTIIAFMQFTGVLIDFGLQMVSGQMISQPDADENKIFNNILTLRLVSAVVFLGSAVAISWLLPYPMIIKQGITIASLSFLFSAIISVIISIFQKKIDMAKVAIAEVWNRIVMLLGVWLAVSWSLSLLYIVMAVAIGGLVNLLILIYSAKGYVKIRLAFDRQIWRQIFIQSWPLAITVALSLIYFRADTIVMSLSRPQSEVGLYGAGYKVVEILVQFPYLFLGLILPILTKFFVVNKKIFDLTVQKAFDFLVIIALPMVFSVLVLGEKIMVFIAGDEFIISGIILKILIFAVAIIYLGALFTYTIVACGQQKRLIKFYLFTAVLAIILYIILIPRYSYWAAAPLTIMTEL